MTTRPIAQLSLDQVRTEVGEVLARDLDAERLADFLASVDWGGAPGSPEVRELLGALETAATEYSKGDLTEEEYRARLQSVVLSDIDQFAFRDSDDPKQRHPDTEPRPSELIRPDGSNQMIFKGPEGADDERSRPSLPLL